MADYISKFQYNGTTWDMKDAEARQALASCVNNGYYDSNAKKIILRHDRTTIVQIDATDFIKDGMVSNVQVVNGYLVITFNTDAGQEPIRIPITDIFNPDNYYTKSATNGLLALKQDLIQDLAQIRQGASAGSTAYQKPQGGIPKNDLSQEVQEALDNTGDVSREDLENGNIVPLYAKTLAPWADQKAIATPDTYTDAVRTTGGDIPIETSAGSKIESIKPVAGSKWTAKMLFNGSYNMLNAAKWGAANSQPYVGGVGSNFVYFLVPELTLGTFGTADENNGLLFTDSEGENVQPTSVYFKSLGATVPQSLTDGTSITPTSVSYDGNTYKTYETSGAGWLIVPKTIYDNDVCAHIAWEDWYDKYVSLDEPTTNPEAVVGTLILEGLLALAHSDKYLRGVNDEVCDNVVFGDTSATITHMVDELSVAANAWTNAATGESDSHGNSLYRHSAIVSGIKQGGAACVEGEDGGIPLTVNGTTVSYVDTNATAPASVVFYQIPTTAVVEKAYTDNIFSGSNINTETGILPINDCSIEAQVAMDGKANITVKYAKNIVDQVAINATVDVPQIKEQVEEHEERITELEDTAVRTGSYDVSVSVGLADNLRGDTIVDAEFYKRKTGGTQSVGSGIAAIKEMRGKSIVWNQILDADDWVDMGLPSGTLWCKKNLDATQPNGLAASEFQYECTFFSWGNKKGHNPVNGSFVNVYDWNQTNYDETEGAALTSDADIDYDGAIETIGGCFRDPSKDDFVELLNNIDYVQSDGVTVVEGAKKIVTVNGVSGIYLRSKINGNLLFFPRTGFGDGTTLNFYGGYYWTRSFSSQTNGYTMYFMDAGIRPQGNLSRYYGYARRPVLYKSTSTQDGKYNHKYAVSSNGKNLTDVTLMFGSGNEPTTVAEFEKMFPLDRYDYNEGEVIPFAGQNLVTTGFNQWDEQWTQGDIDDNTGNVTINMSSSRVLSKNYIKVIPNTTYNINGETKRVYFYDENKAFISSPAWMASGGEFTTPNNAYLMLFKTGPSSVPYNHDICINISDEDRNGTYEPYEKHTLPLDPSQWRDKQGNLVFPYGGMHGVGTAYDYAKVDADGYIRKAVRCFERVDLGTLYYNASSQYGFHSASLSDKTKKCGIEVIANVVCSTLNVISSAKLWGIGKDKHCIAVDNQAYIRITSTLTDVATFKTSMDGVILYYELAEPVEVELATPVYAKYLVDKDGTEEITPANGTKPYTTMANLSILYAMDARGEIKNLPKNYLNKESAENMLNAMVSAGVIASYTMTYDASSGRYQFVIVKP